MKEITRNAMSGFIFIIIEIVILALLIGIPLYGIVSPVLMFILVVLFILTLKGFMIVNPNEAKVLVFFGEYTGTIRKNGFFWINPFYSKQRISLRARNFDSERLKVNDKRGNPILISVILVWKVDETYKAAFEVDDFESFVRVQTDAAVRKLAGMYSYDTFDDDQNDITLRSSLTEVNDALEEELTERLNIAGIQVIEARIGYLAYAPEIANAMLKRQQAEAIVAARLKIVEGAVGMVENALTQLSKRQIIDLDDEKKASMVSNLMIVLCSDKEVTPVINTGTLNS